MPVVNKRDEHDEHDEHDDVLDDRDNDKDRDRERGSKKSSSSKSKDLSHVPCKFFKVGSCTAGASCPFSHSVLEPGQQKDICAWFIKGNCKFGHKCALAHVLPGQSMAMDRKNKKAAQNAAKNGGSAGGGNGEKSGNGGGGGGSSSGGRMHKSSSSSSAHGNGRGDRGDRSGAGEGGSIGRASGGGLLSGSTAPTRILTGSSGSRAPIPMSLKATISPSAPAPPLKDTDFASFGLPDESNKLPSAPAALSRTRASLSPVTDKRPSEGAATAQAEEGVTGDFDEVVQERTANIKSSPSPLPFNTPRPPRTSHHPDPSASGDLGPIGSPPRSLIGSPPLSQTSRSGLNGRAGEGFSPGTSPQSQPYLQPTVHSSVPANAFLSSSPFSKGVQGMFLSKYSGESAQGPGGNSSGGLGGEEDDFRARSGLAASLGATHTWRNELGMSSSANVQNPPPSAPPTSTRHPLGLGDIAVVDEDLEEFIPPSLTDLLTPEERSRRYSRTGVATPSATGWGNTNMSTQRPSAETHHHRYSRSVPAPSLLGDIKSIWSDPQPNNNAPHLTQHNLSSSPANPSLLSGGLPGSYKTGGFGADGMHPSTSLSGAGAGFPTSMSPSSSFLSPSNASAAFLPSIHQHHQHFMAKRSTSGAGLRPLTSTGGQGSGSATPVNGGGGMSSSPNAAQLLARLTGGDTGLGMSSSPPPPQASASFRQAFRPPGMTQSTSTNSVRLNDDLNPNNGGRPQTNSQYPHLSNAQGQPYTPTSAHHNQHHPHHVPPPMMALSPSTRALQAHAPGQSLPQGLAAGYSRIHALPPPPSVGNLPSPSAFGSVTSGGIGGVGSQGATSSGLGGGPGGPGGAGAGQPSLSDWIGMSPGAAAANGHSILGRGSPRAGAVALPGMGSRQPSGSGAGAGMGPGRSWANIVGGREGGVGGREGGVGTLSPLSGPVVSAGGGAGDDDDLFVLDG